MKRICFCISLLVLFVTNLSAQSAWWSLWIGEEDRIQAQLMQELGLRRRVEELYVVHPDGTNELWRTTVRIFDEDGCSGSDLQLRGRDFDTTRTFSCDSQGNIVLIADGSYILRYRFDPQGKCLERQRSSNVDGQVKLVDTYQYAYHGARLISVAQTSPSKTVAVRFKWSSKRRMVECMATGKMGDNRKTGHRQVYLFDEDGHLQSVQLKGRAIYEIGYDALRRVVSRRDYSVGGETLNVFDYEYYENGLLKSTVSTGSANGEGDSAILRTFRYE